MTMGTLLQHTAYTMADANLCVPTLHLPTGNI